MVSLPADPLLELGQEAPARIACSLYQSASVGNFLEDGQTCELHQQQSYFWGRNVHNMFNLGLDKPEVHSPTPVHDTLGGFSAGRGSSDNSNFPVLRGVWEVACGLNHTLFLVSNSSHPGGAVYGCGLGCRGRLATVEPKVSPATPSASSSKQAEIEGKWTTAVKHIWPQPSQSISVLKVCCGSDHTLALAADASGKALWSWGLNQEGQCGVSDTRDVLRPTRVAPLTGAGQGAPVAAFAAGGRHSMLVTGERPEGVRGPSARGLLYTWGCNQGGRLGNGSTTNQTYPSLVKPLTNPRRTIYLCAGGESHSGAVDSDCRIWTWGVGSYGRLGIGENIDTPTPRMVSGVLDQVKVIQLALGGWHSVALTSDGRLYSWGRGAALGLLRDGDSTIVKEPRLVHTPELQDGEVAQIAAGTYHTLILAKNGDIYACGLGANGRLGTGDKLNRDSGKPVKVKPGIYFDGLQGHPGFRFAEAQQRFGVAPDRPAAAVAVVAEGQGDKGGQGAAAAPASTKRGEDQARAAAPDDAGDEAALDDGVPPEDHHQIDQGHVGQPAAKEVKSFGMLQDKLQTEPPDRSEREIKKLAVKVNDQLLRLLEAIGDVPQREAQFHLMRSKFDSMFAKNLKFIKAGEPAELVGGHISAYLEYFEELVGVLQSQVAYLVSLSLCLDGVDEQKVLYDTTRGIFRELEDDRTRYLFSSLLRELISKEIEQTKKLEDVFHHGKYGKGTRGKDRSASFHLLSFFALHEIHYKTLVYPIMDHRREASLIRKIAEHCDRDEVWAVTVNDYKSAPQIADKIQDYDAKEQQVEFSQSILRFQEFIRGDFVRCIKAVRLPPIIRKLLGHARANIRRRRFFADLSGDGLSEEQSYCEPILRLFVLGVLVPMFRDAKRYAGRMAYLGSDMERKLDQETMGIKFNLESLAKFLEMAMGHGHVFDETVEGRGMKKTGQWLRPVLLNHLMAQITEADDVHTQLLFAVVCSHYDLKPKTVRLSSSTLLLLANLLRKNISKLSMKDNDAVGRLCGDEGSCIKEFSADEINAVKQNDVLHVLRLDVRFLLKDLRMTVCSSSNCPLPPQLSTEVLAPGQSFGNLVRKAQLVEDKKVKVLEEVFVEVPYKFLSTTFDGLHRELQSELQENLKPGRSGPGLDRLSAAVDIVAEYKEQEVQEEELFENLETAMSQRKEYVEYLEQLELGFKRVRCARDAHSTALIKATKMYEATNRFSHSLRLPIKLTDTAQDLGTSLRLEGAAYKIAHREEFLRTPKAHALASNAVVTHPLKKLLNRKVVLQSWIGEPRDVRVTFHLRDGGVDITILLKRETTESIIQKISVTEERLRALRKAEEGETVGLPLERPVLTFSITKLVDLLGDAASR